VQDAIEIGAFRGSTMRASIKGLRAGNSLDKGGPLDDMMARLLFGPGGAVLSIGVPRITHDWIDQFGNLELSPPYVSPSGKAFPYGRILTAEQNGLRMHADVLAFLEQQGAQWPPLFLDAGFVLVGHVDELVSFVPLKGGGYRVLVASPARGIALLEDLARAGHGSAALLSGKRERPPTIAGILADEKLMAQNREAEARMQKNRAILVAELRLPPEAIVEIPVMFEARMGGGMALWPNMVNGLTVGSRYIAPRPFGPRIDGKDALEEAARKALARAGVTDVRFVDNFAAYSDMGGEVHCGTNALRQPKGERQMQLVRLE
jgi:protein-arginine deiminase